MADTCPFEGDRQFDLSVAVWQDWRRDKRTLYIGGTPAMLVKLVADMVKTQTVTCGEVDMILGSVDYAKLNVAICPNIKPTIAHYHPGFDEIYFVLDGWIHIKTYDPKTGKYAEQRLGQNEMALFPMGMHHVITEASDVNRLCVLMIPGFISEVPSDKL